MATTHHLAHRKQRQERLTLVGPGTPMGKYMRCFWHPVAAMAELRQEPVLAVKLLGEQLALFQSADGSLGLVAARCAHRGTSLGCGMLDGDGIRCAYHGWKYDKQGQCVDTPAESESSTLKRRIKIASYPVETMGGLVWTPPRTPPGSSCRLSATWATRSPASPLRPATRFPIGKCPWLDHPSRMIDGPR